MAELANIIQGSLNSEVEQSGITKTLEEHEDNIPLDTLRQQGANAENKQGLFSSVANITLPTWLSSKYDTYTEDNIPDTFNETDIEYRNLIMNSGLPPEVQANIFGNVARNRFAIEEAINHAKEYQQSEKEFSEAPLYMSIPATLVTSPLDPTTYMFGAGFFNKAKVGGQLIKSAFVTPTALANDVNHLSTSAKILANATPLTAGSVAKNAGKGALLVGGVVGVQEYELQDRAYSFDANKFASTVGFASTIGLFGGGLSEIARKYRVEPSGVLHSAEELSAMATRTSDDLLGDFKMNSPLASLVFSTQAKSLNSDNPLVRSFAIKADYSPLSLSNKHGDLLVQDTTTAMDFKHRIYGLYNSFRVPFLETAHKLGLRSESKLADLSNKHGREYLSFENFSNKSVEEALVNNMARNPKFMEETYLKLKGVDDISKLTDISDMEALVLNHIKKEMVAKGILKAPSHLKYVSDFFSSFVKIADKIKHRAISNKVGETYLPIDYNADYIASLGQQKATEKLLEAMKASPFNKYKLSVDPKFEKELSEYANGMVKGIIESTTTTNLHDGSVRYTTRTTSPYKQRTAYMDRDLIPDFFITDLDRLAHQYTERTAGRMALDSVYGIRAEGTKSLEDAIVEFMDVIKAKGIEIGQSTKKLNRDLSNVRAIIDGLTGSRRYVKDPNSFMQRATSILTKFNNARFSAGWSQLQLGEIGGAIMSNGIINVLTNFIPAHRDIIKLVRSGGHSELHKDILALGIGDNIMNARRLSKYDIAEISSSATKYEEWLDKASHAGKKYSGFNHITAISELMTAGATVRDILNLSNSGRALTDVEMKKFSRWGLSAKDIKDFTRKANKIEYYKGTGVPKSLNINDWADQAYAEKIMNAITRASRESILRSDVTFLPRALSDVNNPLLRLMTQYLHFPAMAHERLMLRGLEEGDIRAVVGMITSMSVLGSIALLRREAEIALGVREERMDANELGRTVYQKNPFLGTIPTIIQSALSLVGEPDVGTDYRSTTSIPETLFGASAGTLKDFAGTLQALYRYGTGETTYLKQSDMARVAKLAPFSSFPLLTTGIDSLVMNVSDDGKPKKSTATGAGYNASLLALGLVSANAFGRAYGLPKPYITASSFESGLPKTKVKVNKGSTLPEVNNIVPEETMVTHRVPIADRLPLKHGKDRKFKNKNK